MKVYRLGITLFLCLYSCTSTVIQNTTSSPSNVQPTAIATNQSENISSPNIQVTPSANIIPSPSSTGIINARDISSITIIADDNTVIGKETFKTDFSIPGSYNLYSYNILPNEKKKFDAYFVESSEIKEQDILWSSSNTDIATVDSNGLVSSTNKNSSQELIGFTIIKAYVKSNPEIAVSFTVNLYNKLEVTVKNKNSLCQEVQSTVTLPRYQSINGFSEIGGGGITPDIRERTTFYGRIYDKDKNLLDGVNITAETINEVENSNTKAWKGEPQTSVQGAYVFRNVPTCDEILIIASKNGYATKTRKIISKSNLNGDPEANQFNFGGNNPDESIYALEKLQY